MEEPQHAGKNTQENRIVAAISYIPLLFLVPLLWKTDSDFAQFHGKQGLVLFIAWFILWVVGLIPVIGLLALLGYLLLIVVAVIAFVRALLGQRWEIPLIAPYAKKLKL
jgi:uncharacterized membrane protein